MRPCIKKLKGLLESSRPLVMGILNVTPDSFSDGGQLFDAGGVNRLELQRRILQMIADGADILDIGGESTRPGATPVSVEEELSRVIPAVTIASQLTDAPVSVDTSQPEVIRQAIAAGAAMINDVRALSREGAIQAVAETDAYLCLMHMQNQPSNMQQKPEYAQVSDEVYAFLKQRAQTCISAGISAERISIDPGFGFGKTLEHNLQLLRDLRYLDDLGYPILVGLSRKSMIEKITGRPPQQRLAASLALAQTALLNGAQILRVHDVSETFDMVRCFVAVQEEK